MDSSRLKHHGQDMYGSSLGPPTTYYEFRFSVFMGFLRVQMNGLEIFEPSLGIVT